MQAWYRLSAAAAMGLAAYSAAQAPADKSGYTLVNPTPRELMREMSPDRPDTTESPFTVDAGHFQIELSFVDFVYDDTDGVRTRSASVAPLLLRAGLTDRMEASLGLSPYTWVRTEDDSGKTTDDGFGDVVLRLKVNLWGNEEGRTAFGVMPYVKFPTASDGLGNDHVEGGLILPFAMDLGNEFSLGAMAAFDVVRDSADDGYVVDFVHSVTVGRPLFGDVGGYVEYAGMYNFNADEDYRAYFDAGLTWGVTEDIQLDAGVRIGLTDAADDFGVFAGISLRY
jgi:hypothetical protein